MSIIEVDQLTVRYGRRPALDGVTFAVPDGATGLLGPNGAGKSTLMKALLGFLHPDGGAVRVFGMGLPAQALEIRHRIGYMPERDLMSPKVSAVSFLVYCGRLHGMTRPDAMERAHAVLNYVGLDDSRYRRMETYSKGMCQRVKFAQAVIHDPKLLLLDEPTNGLDPEGREEMLHLIRELTQKRDIAVVVSTHLLPDVQAICDHVVIVHEGHVVQQGEIGSLTDLHQGHYEVRVHGHAGEFVKALQNLGCAPRTLLDGTLRIVRPEAVTVQDLFRAAREVGTHIRHMKPVRQSLEAIFLEAIGHGDTSGDGFDGSLRAVAPPPVPAVKAGHDA